MRLTMERLNQRRDSVQPASAKLCPKCGQPMTAERTTDHGDFIERHRVCAGCDYKHVTTQDPEKVKRPVNRKASNVGSGTVGESEEPA